MSVTPVGFDLTPTECATLTQHGRDANEFLRLVAAYRANEGIPLVQGRLEKPDEEEFVELPAAHTDDGHQLFSSGCTAIRSGALGVLVMNGGMATRFGGAIKGLCEALPGRSFLELKLRSVREWQQQLHCRIPVVIMNSQATDQATRAFLREHDYFGLSPDDVLCFTQTLLPRLRPDGTIYRDRRGELSLYPPGHGDLLHCLRTRGVLRWLQGKNAQMLLVSNVDNLGASPHPGLMGYFLGNRQPLLVEVAPQVPTDPGGCPIAVDGRVCVVEKIACPPEFPYSDLGWQNTNTLWLRLEAARVPHPLTWYPARKQIFDATSGEPVTVVQLEQLVGQISWFVPTGYVRVSQRRFMPMKTPEHLAQWRPALDALFPTLC